MTGFKPYNQGNPCPVCQGIKDCKFSLDSDLVLCHSYTSYDPGIPGWAYTGESSIGVWGKFYPDNGKYRELSEFDRETRRIEKENKRQQEKAALKAKALSRDDRDKAIREINKVVGLTSNHRYRLQNRGLTDEQINKYLLTSKVGYQEIPQSPLNLPGVYRNGKNLSGKNNGIICPSFDYQGRATGWQVRRDNAKDGENKYIWAVSHHPGEKISSKLPNNEYPTTLVRESKKPSATLYVAEGLLKPIVAGCRHQIDIAGCPVNGNFHLVPKQVKEFLSLGYERVIIVPDAGDVINPKVMKRWEKQIEFFNSLGVNLSIAWWSQVSKKAGDIDEIASLENVELISPEEFLEIGKKFKNEIWKSWINAQEFTPHKTFESQYVSYDIPSAKTIFALKSDMGTGKTTALVDWIREINKTQGIISIGYRNGLLYQFCQRTNFDHIHEEQALTMLAYDKATIALCADSLLKFQPEDFNNKVIVLDEATSIIRHLLLSSTLKKNRDKILGIFSEAIQRCDRVIMLDGNMTDWAVDYISQLTPDKQILKVENTYKRNEGRQALFVTGTVTNEGKINKRNSSGIKQRILSAPRPFIATDSQTQAEVYDILLSEQGSNVLRIDSTTTHTDAAKEFLADCDAYIEKHKPDAVIVTPSAESGVDISIQGYFTHNFLICCGVIGTPALMQLGNRLRDKSAQMIVWAGSNQQLQDLSPEGIVEEIVLFIKAHDLIEINGHNEATIRNALLASIKRDKDSLLGRLRTFLAFEKANLLETLQMSFAKNGWEIEDTADLNCTQINKLFKETKVELQKAKSTAIFNAKDIPESSLNYNAKFNSTPEELYARAKAHIKRLLPGIENTDIWTEEFIYQVKFKHPELLNKINIRYLFDNPEIAKELNTKTYAREYAKAGMVENMSLMNMRTRGDIALALRKTGIEKIIDAPKDKQWLGKDPEIIEIHKKLSRSPVIRQKLGIKNLSKYPIMNVNSCLAHFDLRLVRGKSIWKDKTSVETYHLEFISANDHTHQICYGCTETRWLNWLDKEFETLARQVENSQNKVDQSYVTQMLQVSRLAMLGKTLSLYKKNTLTSQMKIEFGNYTTQIERTISKLRRRIRKEGFQNERYLTFKSLEEMTSIFLDSSIHLLDYGWDAFKEYLLDIGDFMAYQVLNSMYFLGELECQQKN